MKKLALLSLASAMVGGCAYYPDLYSVDTTAITDAARDRSQQSSPGRAVGVKISRQAVVPSKAGAEESEVQSEQGDDTPILNLTSFERAIRDVSALQEKYETGYKDVRKMRDILQLPILVAAGASGLVLVDGGVFEKGDQTQRAAEISVIAATFAAGRSALTSPEMALYYIKGHGALNCVLAYGMNFARAPGSRAYESLVAALRSQSVDIKLLEDLLSTVPSDADGAETLKAARAVASTTLASARTARTAALGHLGAVNQAEIQFNLEASEISMLVASAGQVRTIADFGTITAGFNQPATTETVSDAAVTADTEAGADEVASGKRLLEEQEGIDDSNTSPAALAQLIAAQSERLLSSTSTLTGSSPPYTGSLTEMRACSEIVS